MPPTDSPPKRVLVVDDEAGVVTLATRILSIGGYAATGTASAREGLRLFEKETWDLVITDRSMPEMSGEELASLVKQRSPETPVIIITGFPGDVKQRTCVDAILQKPFAFAELLDQVAKMVGK